MSALTKIINRRREAEIARARRDVDREPYGPTGSGTRFASDSGFAAANFEARMSARASLEEHIEAIDAFWRDVHSAASAALDEPGFQSPAPSLDACLAFIGQHSPAAISAHDGSEAARYLQCYLVERVLNAAVDEAERRVRGQAVAA